MHFQPFKIKSNFEINIAILAILREFHREKGENEEEKENKRGKKERKREREKERG